MAQRYQQSWEVTCVVARRATSSMFVWLCRLTISRCLLSWCYAAIYQLIASSEAVSLAAAALLAMNSAAQVSVVRLAAEGLTRRLAWAAPLQEELELWTHEKFQVSRYNSIPETQCKMFRTLVRSDSVDTFTSIQEWKVKKITEKLEIETKI